MNKIPFYGYLTWPNFTDWLVTICLCVLFVLAGVSMGSVRPNTHLLLLPGFALLLSLHGAWYLTVKSSERLSLIPFLFLPFLLWAAFSSGRISPMAWRGWQDWIYYMEAFILLWVLCNNGQTVSHLWFICISALIPVGYGTLLGFYQLFQNPNKIADAFVGVPIEMSGEYVGRSIGVFVDPHSFALLLLFLFPCIFFVGLSRRLSVLLRILCLYIAAILLVITVLTEVFWVLIGLVIMLLTVACFLYKNLSKRIRAGLSWATAFLLFAGLLIVFNEVIREQALLAWSTDGEGVRRLLWPEALNLAMENIVFGGGGGAFRLLLEQSPRIGMSHEVQTPLNDILHLSVEYGLLGLLFIVVPILLLLIASNRSLSRQPYQKYSGRTRKRLVMPTQRFFISLSLIGALAFFVGSFLHGVLLLPALLFHGTLFLGVLIKTSFKRTLILPHHWFVRSIYGIFALFAGLTFWDFASPVLRAREIEMVASQRLEEIVERKLHLSGNLETLNEVLAEYANGCLLDPENADLWLGRSQASAQRIFTNPSLFREIGEESLVFAKRAVEISPSYNRAWSQLGLAYALSGNTDAAEEALLKGLALAPNSSNAHYYWSSFAGAFEDKMEAAKKSAKRAVEINPQNGPALRVNRKLNIL